MAPPNGDGPAGQTFWLSAKTLRVGFASGYRLSTILALALFLAGCGGGQAALPTPTPTAAPTATAAPPPTATPGTVQPVILTPLQIYTDQGGAYTVALPVGWTLQDQSRPDELVHVWTDPTRNGALVIDLFATEVGYTEAQLTDILKTFLQNTFGELPDYQVGEPQPLGESMVSLSLSYTTTAAGGLPVAIQGDSRITQGQDHAAITVLLVPAEQYTDSAQQREAILEGFRVLTTAGSP